MTRQRVLCSAALPGGALERLAAAHDVTVGEPPTGLGRDAIAARIAPFDALLTLLSDRVDAELLARAPRLRVIANYAVGTDNLDLEACAARGVTVTNTPGVLTDATADLALALMLDACRRVSESDRLARAGAWRGWAPGEMLGVRATGATLGLVGFGRIGQAVARRARGFDMRVMYCQRRRADPAVERAHEATFAPLDELLAASDIVSLHCPLTPETRGLLSRERLARMKRGSVLVNTARGACVDARALAEAVRSGHLAGAGLDVYTAEPAIEPELRAEPRIVLSTHIGSADGPTRAKMADMCVDALLAALGGGDVPHRVGPLPSPSPPG